MDDKKEYIQIEEKEISLDDYPFFKLICIIGFTYGVIVLISYIILIHILKIYSLKPIFYIAILIEGILALLYIIFALLIIVDMTERTAEKPKNNNGQ
jgi:predicted neutral ceramidase superfamily lipid hydrolase